MKTGAFITILLGFLFLIAIWVELPRLIEKHDHDLRMQVVEEFNKRFNCGRMVHD
jgi:hypothetical protein